MRASSLLRTVRGSGLAGLPSSFLQKAGRGNGCSCGMKSRPLSSIVETLSDYERDQPSDAGTMMKKEASLHHALGQLAGDFDRESNLSLCRFFRTRYAPAISTGSLMLDLALGIGGLPKGRIVEIYGREASGKTTLALHVVKEAQKLGGYCAYLDVENALDSLYAEQMGVKTEDLLIAHPNSAESSLGIVNTLINSGSLDVIVVDSVAALVPQCEIDGVININSKDVQSRLITQALHKIHYSLSRSQTLVIFVNHVRTNLRSSGGLGQENVVACGGKALKFYSAVRMKLLRRDLLHNEDKVTGIGISVQVMKNKLAPPLKMASLDIEFGRGVRWEVEVLEMACKHGLVMREGNGYWIKGTSSRARLKLKSICLNTTMWLMSL
ncbi:DNA repair protein recA-like protein 2, mitochondrial isoform X1 [Iris pallida]|uniref:DNA repair protein recA-like protein 2, mitochondrial isoform X1 n=1 Tax=Iris pallida TaxID=29817 RepID=A0AAX6EXJ0_IRIPA|nr:DNA repair protein recA-like protein 2, mitochondrial isoform X1 [Iris pallida]